MTPTRIIALGFLIVILTGALLLFLPVSQREGATLSFPDALFMSVSSVCVTGLGVVDVADTFTVFGRIVMMVLIQIGGLGVATVGVLLIMLAGRHINFSGRQLIRESMNLGTLSGTIRLLRFLIRMALLIELAGAALTFLVLTLSPNYSGGVWQTIGISLFHSVSAFNNAGFDLFGGGAGMSAFSGDIGMSLVTSFLIISGGIGFFVIAELLKTRRFRKLSLHSKVVLSMTGVLLLAGTLLLKLSEGRGLSLIDAFFTSVSARTAGFSTAQISGLSEAGLLVMMVLMFIGASSGSTGGGIKTGTFFVMLASIVGSVRGRPASGFRRRIPDDVVRRAFLLFALALTLVFTAAFAVMKLENGNPGSFGFADYIFEVISAFATVGLSTGITGTLTGGSRTVLMILMFVGRMGPLTVASLMVRKDRFTRYSEETLTIG